VKYKREIVVDNNNEMQVYNDNFDSESNSEPSTSPKKPSAVK